METIFYVLCAAAFFAAIIWFTKRRRQSTFTFEGDNAVPFSYAEAERKRARFAATTTTDH